AGARSDRAARWPRRLARDRAGGRPAQHRDRRRGARGVRPRDRLGRRLDRRRARGALERVRLASRNAHKARELEVLLPGWHIEPYDADDYPPETGETYRENARGKARFAWEPGLWSLGEDSGIEVAVLGGRPGILSARYAP